MFRFIKKCLFVGSLSLSNLVSTTALSCISMSNQACKARPGIININSNNLGFYPFSIKTNKCSSNCNNVNDPYVKMCVPGVVKDLNVKVFNLRSRTNETRHIKWHETCRCKCRLDAMACNNKHRWNNDKCRCECKEMTDKCVCDKGYAWNPSNCECKCDKSCDVGKYLDYENCKCRKRLVDKLVDECDGNINEEVKILDNNENNCNSGVLYILLFSISFTINVGIATYFVYYKYMNRNKENVSKYDYVYYAKNY